MELIQFEIGNAVSLEEFSNKTKSCKPEKCPCRLYLNYINQVSYFNV